MDSASPLSSSVPSPQQISVVSHGKSVPAVVWWPLARCRGVVVALHGGSGHKTASSILSIAHACLPLGLAVLSIDGPVHGDRANGESIDVASTKLRFRAAWRQGVGRHSVAEDLSAALDTLLGLPDCAHLPVGYVGVSMGTAYGLPFLANDSRVRAAAIGLWSTTYAASEHLASAAQRVRCAVWFTQQWNDEVFDRASTQELFDSLATSDKRLVAYTGGHRELEGERLNDAVQFLALRLLA